MSARAQGLYYTFSRAIRMLVANEPGTFFHEHGHHLDLALFKIPMKDPKWSGELLRLGAETSMPNYTPAQILREGAAEFFRRYVTERDTLDTGPFGAPNYLQEFEKRLAEIPGLQQIVLAAQRDYGGLARQTPADQFRQQVNLDTPPSLWRKTVDALSSPERRRELLQQVRMHIQTDQAGLNDASTTMALEQAQDRLDAETASKPPKKLKGKALADWQRDRAETIRALTEAIKSKDPARVLRASENTSLLAQIAGVVKLVGKKAA
jgi:hypothetical protein